MPQVGVLTGPAPVAGGQGVSARPAGAAEALGLKSGDVVEGGLVENLGNGEGIVDLGGRLVRAAIPEGLAAGLRAALRVVSTGPPLVLKLPMPGEEALVQRLSPPSVNWSQVLGALLSSADGRPEEVAQLVEPFLFLRLPISPADLAPLLAQLVRKSGLYHEALLARGEDPGDLKALALRLLARSSDPGVVKLAEALLGHVEAHQARSVFEGAVVVPFALPWGDEPLQGEWVVEERSGRRPNGEAESGLLRVRLHLPRLGPVEASFQWGPAGNAVRLRLAPEGLSAVSPRLPELARALVDEASLPLVSLRVEPLAPAAPKGARGLLEVLA